MDITVTISDESVDALAAAIVAKMKEEGLVAGGGAAEAEGEDDDFGGETATAKSAEITLEQIQDAVKEAVGKHGKDKVKAFVKKTAGVDKVVEIPKDKYQAIIDGLKKIK